MSTPDRQWRMRRTASGTWTPWASMQNNFQYMLSSYDSVEFRVDPGPCTVESPVFLDGVRWTCENIDATHTDKHKVEFATYDSYGSYTMLDVEWETN